MNPYGEDSIWVIAARLLIVFSFLVQGLSNLTAARVKDHIDRMVAFGVPIPAAVFWSGIVIQLASCALLLAGWQARIGLWGLIFFTVAATAIFHRFWNMSDPMRRNFSRIALLSNCAILGGLLLLLEHIR